MTELDQRLKRWAGLAYIIQATNVGYNLRVQVTVTNDGASGTTASATTAVTANGTLGYSRIWDAQAATYKYR